jgi:hypothetical protein
MHVVALKKKDYDLIVKIDLIIKLLSSSNCIYICCFDIELVSTYFMIQHESKGKSFSNVTCYQFFKIYHL